MLLQVELGLRGVVCQYLPPHSLCSTRSAESLEGQLALLPKVCGKCFFSHVLVPFCFCNVLSALECHVVPLNNTPLVWTGKSGGVPLPAGLGFEVKRVLPANAVVSHTPSYKQVLPFDVLCAFGSSCWFVLQHTHIHISSRVSSLSILDPDSNSGSPSHGRGE